MQLGISIFSREEDEDGVRRLVARPFNVYVFPQDGKDLTMNLSSISFLRQVRNGPIKRLGTLTVIRKVVSR